MTPNEKIDRLLKQLSEKMPGPVKELSCELKRCADAGAETLVRKMNLVSREEYDIQVELVKRLRAQLAEMQARLDQLESGDKPDK